MIKIISTLRKAIKVSAVAMLTIMVILLTTYAIGSLWTNHVRLLEQEGFNAALVQVATSVKQSGEATYQLIDLKTNKPISITLTEKKNDTKK